MATTLMDLASRVLLQDPACGEVARYWVPPCADKLVLARQPFPVHHFRSGLDAGAVKARYRCGPLDPVVLYIGDMDERHGPDVLVKSMPAVLKNTRQVRLVMVGDGSLFWPMRVHARYLLMEHAVVLAQWGTDVRIGEVPGEYCPGEFSLNVAGTSKVAGSAQRVTKDGWLFSTIVQVSGSARIRAALSDAYAALGYEFEPDTVGALEDFGEGFTPSGVAEALFASYDDGSAGRLDDLPEALLPELDREASGRAALDEPPRDAGPAPRGQVPRRDTR